MNAIESLQLNTPSEHERELTITVKSQLVGQEFTRALNTMQRSAHHKGFRPGKMSKNLVMNFYGDKVKKELIEKLIEKSFEFACKEKDLIPVSQPKLEPIGIIEQDKPFTYRALFQVKPKVIVPAYKGLEVSIKKFTFSEVDVEHELFDLQQNMATFVEPSNRLEIKECDLVQCDSIVKVDGAISPAYSHKDYAVPLFAENIPNDLKSALIGKKVAEEAVVTYTMPSDHQDINIAGKECEMLLSIRSFKERVLPALDDDFAKDISDKFQSLNDVKESIRLRFTITAKRRDDYYKQDALTKALVDKNPVEVPPALVERMSLSLINRELEAMGKKVADDLVKNHWQELWHSVQERALFRTKAELLIETLIKDLNITASDEETAAKVAKIKDISQDDASYAIQVEKVLTIIEKEAQISTVEEPLFKEGN